MRRTTATLALFALLFALPSSAGAGEDPAYSVSESALRGSIGCAGEVFVHLDQREPVLLVHGTSTTPEESWSWNYIQTLPEQGFDVCWVRLPNRALSDQQESAEYVVHAVRWMHARAAGREIDVIGHSQGALLPRWALRWWPSLRDMVDDFVPLAAPAHGASGADTLCPTSCAPAVQQMKSGSGYLRALNSVDETPGDVDYTSIFSITDELVQPSDSPPLEGGTNIAVQDVCPGRPVHHFGMVYDAVVWALAFDAFTQDGGADIARLPADICTRTWMPGVIEADVVAGNVIGYGNAYLAFGAYPPSDGEPEPKPYVTEDE